MKNTKKKLVLLAVIFVALLAARMSLSLPQVHASSCEDIMGKGNFFCGGGDEGGETAGTLSFTTYQLQGDPKPLDTTGYNENLITSEGNLKTFILKIVNFALGFLGLIAVLVVIYGGILYVTAAGTEERANKGKKAITYAVIGLLIILGSYAFVNTIIGGATDGNETGSGGGIEGTGDGSGATRNAASFNAAAMQLMAVAQDIYTNFEFLAQATEDLKSIRNDAAKASLNPESFPSKGEILEFLSGVKNKLATMRNRVEQYSESEKMLNAIIRDVETDIDSINSDNNVDWMKPGDPDDFCPNEASNYCPEGDKPQSDVGGCALSRDQACAKKGYIQYQQYLFKDWKALSTTKYNLTEEPTSEACADKPNIYCLASRFGYDYYLKMLTNYVPRIYEVWSFISVVETIAQGEANTLFNTMIENYLSIGNTNIFTDLQGIDENSNGKLDLNEIYHTSGLGQSVNSDLEDIAKGKNSLAGEAERWDMSNEGTFYSAAKFLKNGLAAHKSLYDIILKVKFVDAKLRADTSRGNAPLTVTFTAFDTKDPAGGSLFGGQDADPTGNGETADDLIEWDLTGRKIVEYLELGNNYNTGVIDIGEKDTEMEWCNSAEAQSSNGSDCPVVCDPINEYSYGNGTAPTETEEGQPQPQGTVQGTAWRCTYNYPGVYKVAIKVRSRDPRKFAPGIAVVPIVVTPPATAINLFVADSETSTPFWVSKYNYSVGEDETPSGTPGAENTNPRFREVDANSVAFTLTQAEDGLWFDASKSVPNAMKYKWNFGDGQILENANGKISHEFKELGNYNISLEATNKSGIVDKKKFTLMIKDIVAQFITNPQSSLLINQEITFDGSKSKSDISAIDTYEWTCSYSLISASLGMATMAAPCDGFPATGATIKYTPKNVGTYNVSLKVTDKALNSDKTDSVNYNVKSNMPVAVIDYEEPSVTNPTQIQFDGSGSYDPDAGGEGMEDQEIEKWKWTIKTIEVQNDSSISVPPIFVAPTTSESISPKIKFYNEGKYEVSLKVTNKAGEPSSETKFTVIISSEGTIITPVEGNDGVYVSTDPVDIDWKPMTSTGIIKDGKALIAFEFNSDYVSQMGNQLPYEINFGDGDENILSGTYCKTLVDPCTSTGEVKYEYKKPGKYKVALTVYDPQDNSKTIHKTILIGNGKNPMAKINVMIGDTNMTQMGLGSEDGDEDTYITASRVDSVKFDASESANTDGTGRNLIYSWNFNFEKVPPQKEDLSTNKTASHQYKEIQTTRYVVILKACKKDAPGNCGSDSAYIIIKNMDPIVSGLEAIPDKNNATLTTPVVVNVKAFGAKDSDGKIGQYRWWYAHVDQGTGNLVDEQLGVMVTTSPSAQLTIGSDGNAGDKRQYGFGLTITDGEGAAKTITSKTNQVNNKYLAIPGVETVNEKNDIPIAKFSVDKVKVMIGDKVTFTSTSSDPDGKVEQYMWDLNGNGFGDDEWGKKSIIDYTYDKKNLDGYQVRLKVKDAKLAESAASEVIAVYVDAESGNPTAAFKFQVVPNSNGKEVKFLNNSSADETNGAMIEKCVWDFDSSVDSDGDGVSENDTDSTDCAGPKHKYDNFGEYTVKLTVTDNKGGTDDVTNKFKLPLSAPPTAAFTYEAVDDQVSFTNNSSVDPSSGAQIVEYSWDFDTTQDSDGNGVKDDDKDSNLENPTWNYTNMGTFNVKLTVKDDQGNSDFVVNPVVYGQPGVTGTGSTTGGITGTGGTGTGGTGTGGTGGTGTGGTGTGGTGGTGTGGTGTGTGTLTGTPGGNPQLDAVLYPTPSTSADGAVYIITNSSGYGQVTLDFSKSLGPIARYIFDKNIYSDSDGNGIKDDDEDFNTDKSGTYTPSYHKSGGNVILKFTVKDVYGNSDSINLEIKFK